MAETALNEMIDGHIKIAESAHGMDYSAPGKEEQSSSANAKMPKQHEHAQVHKPLLLAMNTCWALD